MHDVIVAGAGPVGQMLCAVLARRGLQVLLLDAAPAREPWTPDDGFDLRVVALAAQSRELFESLGAWPESVSARAMAYQRMEVWQSQAAGRIEFDAAELGLPELGHIVELPALQSALAEQLAHLSHVTARFETSITGLKQTADRVDVQLADGSELSAGVLIGADGGDSVVRRRAGIGVDMRDYGQRALVMALDTEREHGGTARQVFTSRGPLALLPLANGQVSIVWSLAVRDAEKMLKLDDAALAQELSLACDSLGELRPAGRRACFDLRLLHARRYDAGRVLLLGDAAHVVHPLAGLGLNLGFADVMALDAMLAERGGRSRPAFRAAAVARFARERRAQVLLAIAMIDAIERLFSSSSDDIGRVRGAGLSAVSQAGPIKRGLMRYAVSGRL